MRKRFHPISMCICSHESAIDYEFIFASVRRVIAKLFDTDYRPAILMADGADAITNGFMSAFEYTSIGQFVRLMCWAHVLRAFDKKALSISEPYQAEIREDIESLQISPTVEFFELAYKLFVDKWSSQNDAAINSFLSYFHGVCIHCVQPISFAFSRTICII